MKLLTSAALLTLPLLAQAALPTSIITPTLVTTLSSNVDLTVSGAATSPTYTPSFSGSVTTQIEYYPDTGELIGFQITGGSFSLQDDDYGFTALGQPGTATTSGMQFSVQPTILTVGPATGSTYQLSGNFDLTLDAGTLSANIPTAGFSNTLDFGLNPQGISNPLALTSDITFNSGVVDQINIIFPSVEIYSHTESIFTATVNIASVDTISLTAVPEPASYSVLAGALAVLCVARRRKR